MQEILDAQVSSALYYLALDFLDRFDIKDRNKYMMDNFGELKLMYLTLEQFNKLTKDAYEHFSSYSKINT